jgi:integrase
VDGNAAKDVTRPRTHRPKPVAPSANELRAALTVGRQRDAEVGDAALLLASTGMRKGELLGLLGATSTLNGAKFTCRRPSSMVARVVLIHRSAHPLVSGSPT